ncbi:MAG: hypothetical protein OHK0024_15830 [Thalassobaculales bacterium]
MVEAAQIAEGRLVPFEVFNGGCAVSNFIRQHRTWQRDLVECMKFLLPAGAAFADVGAHIGYFTAAMAQQVGPAGRGLAVEPDAESRELLERNLARLGLSDRVAVEAVAAGAAPSRGVLRVDRANRGASALIAEAGGGGGAPVEVVPLPDLLYRAGLADRRPLLVKIDVQGAERAVLEGLEGFLARTSRRPYLLVEIAPAAWAADGGHQWLAAFIERHGYDVHLFCASTGRRPVPPRLSPATFAGLLDDILRYSESSREIDILLLPGGLWRRFIDFYGEKPGIEAT